MYEDLMDEHSNFLTKYLWKLKLHFMVNVFMWFLNKKNILTKDDLARGKWDGCQKYCFVTPRR
jgi:hypothetical protein